VISEVRVQALGLGGRLWLYSNYHCNLTCSYCLTESGPAVDRRGLEPEVMLALADEAVGLGFTELGITGGEPFLMPWLPDLLEQLARRLPVLVLSNATLFTSRLLARMEKLRGLPVTIQVSLDSAQPVLNDTMRGPRNFAKVIDAIPRLRALGLRVRLATTRSDMSAAERGQLCGLHRDLGIGDEDHVVRPVIRRGRAAERGHGIVVSRDDLPPELTITAVGAFWSPFGPTVVAGRMDTDLLVTRTVRPLSVPARAMSRLLEGAPPTAGDVRVR